MVAYAERMLEHWADGSTKDVHEEMLRLTLRIVSKLLCGVDVDNEAADVSRASEVIMRHFTEWSTFPIPTFVPTPGNLRWRRAIRRLEEIIYEIIQQRRKDHRDTGDLLSLLLHARNEDGSGMTNRQLLDEVMTLVLSGHDTTSLALSWTFSLLSAHPAVAAKVRSEVDAVLGDRAPTMADLPQLRYTEQVVMEAMRLFPPVWSIGRQARQDGMIGAFQLPRKTTILISQYVVHRDPRWYAEPDRFWPERWAEGLEHRLPRFAYFPFGGGPRHCIGYTFAMTAAVLVLATIVRRFQLRLLPDRPVVPSPSITLRPKGGIWMVLARR